MTAPAYDYAVIGAGIGGVSIAYELARAGATVLILEQEERPAFHTTGRSAAMYARGYGNHAVRALTTASQNFYFDPEPGFDANPMIGPAVGCLFIAREDQLDRLTQHERELRQDIDDVRWLDTQAACATVPVLDPAYVAAAVYEPYSASLDVAEIHGNYLRQAKKHGAMLVTNAALKSASFNSGEGWRLSAGGECYKAANLVNAAGAWADHVAKVAGVKSVGIQPMRRTAMIFDAPILDDIADKPLAEWPLLLDVDDAFYFKPEAGKILASPCDETPMEPHDVAPDELDVAICADRVMAATKFDIRHIGHKWAGLRSFAPDRSPVIGPDPDNAAFIWMAGQGGYGIQMGPALARACAGLALQGVVPQDICDCGLDPQAVRADRFRL